MPLPNPVIVVPGITATYLRDEYALPPEIVWSVLRKEYERVSLHPDDIRYEATEPARVRRDQIFEIAYRELVEELRYNLRTREDQAVPVYPFGYDWRHPLETLEAELAAFIDEVIERTKLMKHYFDQGYADDPKVNLVGHSMGGLIVTGYVAKFGKKARVGKVATLATPYRGAFEALIKVVTGTATLGTDAPSSREREAARITPALYHLLPTCAGVEIDPALPRTLFNPGTWQPTIVETLEEYVRLHAVSKRNRKEQAAELFSGMLETARRYRARTDGFKLESAGLGAADWLCVVGVNTKTRIRMRVLSTRKGPEFDLGSKGVDKRGREILYRDNQWGDGKDAVKSRITGDGTVPFEGAIPSFLDLSNLVCVAPEDFGYFEIPDRVVTSVAGFHGILPNMDMLHRLIVRHFTGRPDSRGNTWGRPAPGVRKWDPPLKLQPR